MKWHQIRPGCFFATNPDFADMLGDTDFDVDKCHCFLFQVFQSRLPDFQKSSCGQAGPDLGRAGDQDRRRALAVPLPALPRQIVFDWFVYSAVWLVCSRLHFLFFRNMALDFLEAPHF